jgi:glutathione S-transferase
MRRARSGWRRTPWSGPRGVRSIIVRRDRGVPRISDYRRRRGLAVLTDRLEHRKCGALRAAGLLPTDPRKCADVSRWQFWESCHWDPACATLIFERMLKKVLGQGDPTPAHVEKGEADVRQLGAVLDGVLAGRSHLCGEQLTVADFSVGAWLIRRIVVLTGWATDEEEEGERQLSFLARADGPQDARDDAPLRAPVAEPSPPNGQTGLLLLPGSQRRGERRVVDCPRFRWRCVSWPSVCSVQ